MAEKRTEPADEKRRRFPRIPSSNPVLVRKIGGEAVTRLSSTMVVGLGGCMFLNDQAFGMDSVLCLLISVQGRYIEAKVRVVYELPKENLYEIGVEFIDIPEYDLAVLGELFQEPGTPDPEGESQ